MLISESWLREWASPKLNITQLAECLTRTGLEVTSVTNTGLSFKSDKIVVGEVKQVIPHPQADRLKVCSVDVGRKRQRTIVCGADNVNQGCKVPVALVGSRLATTKIKTTKVRGIISSGMLCSATDLGLAEQADGLLILDEASIVGTSIEQALKLNDKVLNITLAPNRGDCLSVAGVAREISALTGVRLKTLTINKTHSGSKTKLSVKLKAPADCPHYVGRALCGIDMQAHTPDLIREKLRRSGVRSINAVVDVTNYVMLELGQPVHAFDLEKIDREIIVRRGTKSETIITLDGNQRTLDSSLLVIADHSKPLALAGIMGGANSEICANTTDIYLEAAFFTPHAILGKARQVGLQTEASHRFERGVDPTLQRSALDRVVELLIDIVGGQAGPVTDVRASAYLPKQRTILLRPSEIKRKLGIKLSVNQVSVGMKRLGMIVKSSKQGWRITPPSWRFDIQGEHDLIEEVARLYGYENIIAITPTARVRIGAHKEHQIDPTRIRQVMVDRGYFEAITYSFIDLKRQNRLLGVGRSIELTNPIAENMSAMRKSLWPGLIEAIQSNLNRQNSRIKLFEIGHTFEYIGQKRIETNRISAAVTGICFPSQWGHTNREFDFFDLKGDLASLFTLTGRPEAFKFIAATHTMLQPGQSARIKMANYSVGWIGRLHPSHQKDMGIDQAIYMCELDLKFLLHSHLPQFTSFSRFPSVQRDLAIVVNQDVTVESIIRKVQKSAGQLLKATVLFDIYMGDKIEKNMKSLAFSLTFQSDSSSLTAEEIEHITDKIVSDLEHALDARLRS